MRGDAQPACGNPKPSPSNPQPALESSEDAADYANDPVYSQEQQHLSEVYAELQSMAGALAAKMRKNEDAAAATKKQMVEEIKQNYGSDT